MLEFMQFPLGAGKVCDLQSKPEVSPVRSFALLCIRHRYSSDASHLQDICLGETDTQDATPHLTLLVVQKGPE